MIKTQIQFPEPLYKQLKSIAKSKDWTLAEVVRRAGEILVSRYTTAHSSFTAWELPEEKNMGKIKADPRKFRELNERIFK